MKILILRFSSIGDIVLTTPVLRCLKTQKPEHEIHYATKKQYHGLLSNNPYIDKLHLLEGSTTNFTSSLKKENFDLIIDLHNNLRTVNIWSILRVKRYKIDKLNWEKWLMVRLKVNVLPYIHIVDRYMDTISHLGIINDGKGLDYFIPNSTEISQFNLPDNYFVYALGAQHTTKKLPLSKQIELCNSLNQNIVLIGGKEDIQAGISLSEQCKNTINLCGKLNIDQSALIMKNSLKVIAHDTGMMHIAAALNKTIISIWGNTIPEFGMTPYYSNDFDDSECRTLEVNDLSCRPCSKIGFSSCPKGHFKCMMNQTFKHIQ
ncbi:MAG: glycosyltransferase family 9 protein [Bacteroidia bacterium]|nr:glycosyltransferase family 9 protein [Bacteroidia bacterium]